ncbi:NADPH-dependent FMN reductase family protein [Kyrpidia tusciae]|uniref:Flavodoxin/nitric oxide synthase n=1 Tax=Kyrpidia tusciae (strain DSM 2912 / NBRC 15312 / T2) TaxID=562970 RepID=D5WVX0_KYRT2|nr:flavodoxin/nitric oxide synthase [Kyrpidia tusciae]ADG05602.1 flavodoxin/nitric oxide synthase [Kyrpidia tusciae DSM 2912]
MRIFVGYASMNGHTKFLADEIALGAKSVTGTEVVQKAVKDTSPSELEAFDAIIWGSSGIFGNPNPEMAQFFIQLGQQWFMRKLEGKFGGVFGTTSTVHGGIENLLRALAAPMHHHGMIVVSPPSLPDEKHALYACPYGIAATIPVEASKDAPINKPREEELDLARHYGQYMANLLKSAK